MYTESTNVFFRNIAHIFNAGEFNKSIQELLSPDKEDDKFDVFTYNNLESETKKGFPATATPDLSHPDHILHTDRKTSIHVNILRHIA